MLPCEWVSSFSSPIKPSMSYLISPSSRYHHHQMESLLGPISCLPARKERRQCSKACKSCQASHLKCNDQRPCLRCTKKGIECVDRPSVASFNKKSTNLATSCFFFSRAMQFPYEFLTQRLITPDLARRGQISMKKPHSHSHSRQSSATASATNTPSHSVHSDESSDEAMFLAAIASLSGSPESSAPSSPSGELKATSFKPAMKIPVVETRTPAYFTLYFSFLGVQHAPIVLPESVIVSDMLFLLKNVLMMRGLLTTPNVSLAAHLLVNNEWVLLTDASRQLSDYGRGVTHRHVDIQFLPIC